MTPFQQWFADHQSAEFDSKEDAAQAAWSAAIDAADAEILKAVMANDMTRIMGDVRRLK